MNTVKAEGRAILRNVAFDAFDRSTRYPFPQILDIFSVPLVRGALELRFHVATSRTPQYDSRFLFLGSDETPEAPLSCAQHGNGSRAVFFSTMPPLPG